MDYGNQAGAATLPATGISATMLYGTWAVGAMMLVLGALLMAFYWIRLSGKDHVS